MTDVNSSSNSSGEQSAILVSRSRSNLDSGSSSGISTPLLSSPSVSKLRGASLNSDSCSATDSGYEELERTNKHRRHAHGEFQLLHFDQLPEWMRDNHFIRSGYRAPTFSYMGCIRSLFFLHNETGNVMTHLFGGLLFIALGWHAWSTFLQQAKSWNEVAVVYVFICAAIMTLSLSASFHLVSCHSEPVCKAWNKCDYVGIAALIAGSFFPAVYYAFFCNATAQLVYIGGITAVGAATAYVCVDDRMREGQYRWIRAALFIGMGCTGIVPLIHSMIVYGMAHTLEALSVTSWLGAMATTYIVGAIIYAARVPEKWWPGRFDYIGHSHQIFHVFVVCAAVFHYLGVIKAFTYSHRMFPECAI
ncbi:HlyIII-domain-containing protein [Ramicandelaber brevisporus]|nr:HlyIII-domain-containing protein [Ramicandelaber brevisporus]